MTSYDEKIVSKELDFSNSKKSASHGNFRKLLITPISSGNSSPTLSLTSTTNVVFEVPAQVVNLCNSYITMDLLFGAEIKQAHFFSTGQSVIGSLALQARDGTYLVNLQNNASQYCFATALPTRSYTEYMTTDICTTKETVGAITNTCCGVNRTSISNPTPTKVISPADGKANAIRLHIKLGSIPHTLFSLPMDLYFSQILTLTLGVSASNRIGADGAASADADTALTAAPACSNCYLHLQVETDQDICQSLISKVQNGGLNINIPYVYTFKTSGTSSNFSHQLRLNSAFGNKILRIYNTIQNNNELYLTAYQSAALTDVEIRTSVNNQWLSDNALRHNYQEVFAHLKPVLEGSALTNSTDFASFFVYIDNFTKAKPYELALDCVNDGISLDNEVLYTFNLAISNVALHIYSHVVCQRALTISGSQILLR